MAPMMSESLDRRLSLLESLNLKLHLMVCAWCALYLKQISIIRTIAGNATAAEDSKLSRQARERIAHALKQDK
jgi:hypothetical protein